MRKMKALCIILLSLIFLFCTGLEFFNDPVELDPKNKDRMLFQSRTVEGVYKETASGIDDPCYAVKGKISDIGKKYDTFTLVSDGAGDPIYCWTQEVKVKNRVAELKEGDSIAVCGKIKKKLFGKGLNLEVYFLADDDLRTGAGILTTGSGKVYDGSNTLERKIVNPGTDGDDIISYRIPEKWKSVEKKLDDKDDRIYGYQYRLNKIRGDKVPESLYVFYFDHNKNLVDRSQYDQTGNIEEAILKNILGKKDVGKCPESIIKAPYGTEYQYYDDKYEDGENVYHIEFVFRKNGIKGFIIYMYIYRLPERAEDVMYVMRTTEIGD